MLLCQRPKKLTCSGSITQQKHIIGFHKPEKWPGRKCGCKRRWQQWAGRQYLFEVTRKDFVNQNVRV